MRKILCYVLVFIIAFSIISFFAYQFYWKPAEVKVFDAVKLKNEPTKNISEIQTPTPQKILDKNGEEIIWQGESGGFNIRWTDKDIYIEKNGKNRKLFTNFAKKYYDLNFKYESDYSEKYRKYVKTKRLNTCDISIDGQIASLVGRYLTLEIEEYFICGIPQYESHWIVFDLENLNQVKFVPVSKDGYATGHGLNLTDLFEDKNVLQAFSSNAEVSEMFRIYEKNNDYKSTYDLLNWFQKTTNFANPNHKDAAISSDFEFKYLLGGLNSLNTSAMTEFSFDRIENEKIVVQTALESVGKSHEIYFLELLLDIPDSLKKDFELANSRQSGLLGKDSKKISEGNWSSIYFENEKE